MQAEEFKQLKKQGKANGYFENYWRPLSDAFKADREKAKDNLVKKRALELEFKTKVSDAIKTCKNVIDLPACVNDIKS